MRRPGLIPARAGNTLKDDHHAGLTGAHPRSRGEHLSPSSSMLVPPGSSPLARGTRCSLSSRAFGSGLIPARAGNTDGVDTTAGQPRAHPRSRGEHGITCAEYEDLAGSSPLARGTPRGLCRKCVRPGLIPARAGNTSSSDVVGRSRRAHPRSRGEHGFLLWCGVGGLGSSPLARGTPSAGRKKPVRPGLIPARAGNTPVPPDGGVGEWAHPRSRGEHSMRRLPLRPYRGSSPLARGTPIFAAMIYFAVGLIPARAGNTTHT